MAKVVVPLKMKILQKPDGSYDYPAFKQTLRIFQDMPGYKSGSIHYDDVSHCRDDTPDSPRGQRWGLKLVDEEFARQALEAFPDRVFLMTKEEAEDFWDNKVKAYDTENEYDLQALQTLEVEYNLRKAIRADITEIGEKIAIALNPDNDESGIRKNKWKHWQDMIVKLDLEIKDTL